MNKLEVLLTRSFFEEDLLFLRSKVSENLVFVLPEAFTEEAILKKITPQTVALLGEFVTSAMLEAAVSLRLIQIPWTGVERFKFDVVKTFRGKVCNSHSNSLAVAEMAVGLLLSICKMIPLHDNALRQGQWLRPQQGNACRFFPQVILRGKTAGYIGFGAVGQKIASLMSVFGVKGLALNRSGTRDFAADCDYVDLVSGDDAIKAVLSRADFVFVTLPLTVSTRGILDYSKLSYMPPDSFLVNISRGEIIPEGDLFRLLKEQRIAGAAIDTWYNYPSASNPKCFPSVNFPFHELENLVLSPHRAGFAKNSKPHLLDVVENLNRLAKNEDFVNVLDVERFY